MSEKKLLRLDKNGEPFAICPECHSKIYIVEAERKLLDVVYPIDTENLEWETDDYDNIQNEYVFLCPECHKIIAESEDEALQLFLEPDNAEPEVEHTDKVRA